MDNKKADNQILNTKQKINNIDNKLDLEKKHLNKIDEMHQEINSLAKDINKCVELLSKSMKGPTVNNMFQDMENTNRTFYRRATMELEQEEINIKKNINKLYKEKDAIIKEERIKEKRGDDDADSGS